MLIIQLKVKTKMLDNTGAAIKLSKNFSTWKYSEAVTVIQLYCLQGGVVCGAFLCIFRVSYISYSPLPYQVATNNAH